MNIPDNPITFEAIAEAQAEDEIERARRLPSTVEAGSETAAHPTLRTTDPRDDATQKLIDICGEFGEAFIAQWLADACEVAADACDDDRAADLWHCANRRADATLDAIKEATGASR
jgi:hypothetical protein